MVFRKLLHRVGIVLGALLGLGPQMLDVMPAGKARNAVNALGLAVAVISKLDEALGKTGVPASEAETPPPVKP